jgi:hypothetical protein
MSDSSSGNDNDGGEDLGILPFGDGSAGRIIRRVWYDGRWYFSVTDVIAVLTDSPNPRNYWNMLKSRLDDEGARGILGKVEQLKLTAIDGKMRATDCVDAETLSEVCRLVPAAAPWRRKDKPDGIVYAIGLPDGSMVKIGITTDLAARLRSLRYSSPVPLVVLLQMSGDDKLERRLHAYFDHRRAYGEWFSFADADVITELQAAIVAIGASAA